MKRYENQITNLIKEVKNSSLKKEKQENYLIQLKNLEELAKNNMLDSLDIEDIEILTEEIEEIIDLEEKLKIKNVHTFEMN